MTNLYGEITYTLKFNKISIRNDATLKCEIKDANQNEVNNIE